MTLNDNGANTSDAIGLSEITAMYVCIVMYW